MKLAEIIQKTIIQNRRAIGFDEFMALALYHPQLGYYHNAREKFGKKGDFQTAPEISDLFGKTLAGQCAQILKTGDDILEVGAGSGKLCAQMLMRLNENFALPQHYYILETSDFLKSRQRSYLQKLGKIAEKIIWLDALPENFQGVVMMNEILDALPAKRFFYAGGKCFELGVDFQKKLIWRRLQAVNPKDFQLPDFVAENYTTEQNLEALRWVENLGKSMTSGAVLILDYGMSAGEYFHPERARGTLRCYHHHKMGDNPFIHIGQQDMTTSVNFSAIAKTARQNDFEIAGYATQTMFLIAAGIGDFLDAEKSTKMRIRKSAEVKRLIAPDMGESFKVMVLAKNRTVKLSGFDEQNLRGRL